MTPSLLFKLLAFPIFTGVTFHIAAYTVSYFTPTAAAAWRFGLAAAIMIMVLRISGMSSQSWRTNRWIYVVLGILGVFGFNTLFFIGMKYTSPVNGALIMATNPIVTLLAASAIFRSPITSNQIIGSSLSFVGVFLVITQGSWTVISQFQFASGDLIILLGNLCWALYGVLGKKYLQNSSSLETTTYTMGVGALLLVLVASFSHHEVPLLEVPLLAWGGILFMAVCTSVLGYLWWNQAIATIGASQTAIFFNLVPIVAMLTSIVAGEQVTSTQLAGALTVIGGVLISMRVIRLPEFQKDLASRKMN